MRVFFAHPMSAYNTASETAALALLKEAFPDHEIVNPNSAEHQLKGKGNFAYFEKLVSTCDTLAYLPFPDGKIGAGIAGESHALLKVKSDAALHEIDLVRGRCAEVSELDKTRLLTIRMTSEHNRKNPFGQETQGRAQA